MDWFKLIARLHRLRITRVQGESMHPVLPAGGFMLYEQDAYRWRVPQRREIVLATIPRSGRRVVKRIFALPNEEVFQDGVNLGLGNCPRSGLRSWKIGGHECFLVGDNLESSLDSRHFGPVPIANLLGRALRAL